MASFGAFYPRWESFIPLLSPTSQAGRTFSRTNPSTITGTKETTPQHNTPSRAVKHLPPQHATNNPKSPIFTTQGRTFFHNTHLPHNTHPHQGELSFNHRRQDQANQQSHAIPHRPTPPQPHNPQNPNNQASHHETPPRELHAKPPRRWDHAAVPVASGGTRLRRRWPVAGPGSGTCQRGPRTCPQHPPVTTATPPPKVARNSIV